MAILANSILASVNARDSSRAVSDLVQPAITDGEQLGIPWSLIARGLQGVATATKADSSDIEHLVCAIRDSAADHNGVIHAYSHEDLNLNIDHALTFDEWYDIIENSSLNEASQHRANIAIALGHLILSGRQNRIVSPARLDFIWTLIHEALNCTTIPYTVSRSAQGFLAVPLWSVVQNGNIEELFRFHVWLPDGKRGINEMGVHSHQCFGQSWILAGEGTDHSFEAEPASIDSATHAEFGLVWSDSSGKDIGKAYQTHQKFSTVTNTGRLMRVVAKSSETHARGMMYTVPASHFHRSKVAPDTLHSTLFLFDSSRGFDQNAPVLGPIEAKSYQQVRDPAGVTAATLANLVELSRNPLNHEEMLVKKQQPLPVIDTSVT